MERALEPQHQKHPLLSEEFRWQTLIKITIFVLGWRKHPARNHTGQHRAGGWEGGEVKDLLLQQRATLRSPFISSTLFNDWG